MIPESVYRKNGLFSSLLDILFPRICPCCKADGIDKQLCHACWDSLALPDPTSRCRHCFADVEEMLCDLCRKSPQLCFPRAHVFDSSLPASFLQKNIHDIEEALAAWTSIFLDQLAYELPDVVVPVPAQEGGKSVFRIAQLLALLLGRPYKKIVKRTYSAFLQPDISVSFSETQEDQKLLLLDVDSNVLWLKKVSEKLADLFPRKVVIISLFGV